MDGAYSLPHYAGADQADALARHFAQHAGEHDRNGEISFNNLASLRAAGLLGLAIPQGQGGLGADLRRVADIVARIARGDPSTALIFAMQCIHSAGVAGSPLWPQDVRAEVLRSVLQDGALINALRVEPDLGTPARGGYQPHECATVRGAGFFRGERFFLPVPLPCHGVLSGVPLRKTHHGLVKFSFRLQAPVCGLKKAGTS